jgi:hypothetical protein
MAGRGKAWQRRAVRDNGQRAVASCALTRLRSHMAIHLPRPHHDLTLLSTSELTRLLNIPESRMAKAMCVRSASWAM